MSNAEKLSELKKLCEDCRNCQLYKTRTNVVFSKGDPDAKLMFVGEAPGEKEDLSGEPFVGAAGKLLDKYLGYIGLDAKDAYVCNILKCRPPKNRDPLPQEEESCIGYLWKQIEIIKPRVIVCLGRIAAKKLIKEDFAITKEHGKWFEINSTKIMAVYHPAALLRDPHKKEDMLVDFETIAKELESL